MTNNCETCRHFEPFDDSSGFCRRSARRPFAATIEPEETAWPVVFTCDWCGEWQRAEVPTTIQQAKAEGWL